MYPGSDAKKQPLMTNGQEANLRLSMKEARHCNSFNSE
jgi:hypothetical protein